MDWNNWKPKSGDKVICLKSYAGQFTKNKVYIVAYPVVSSTLYVEKDDKEVFNGWSKTNFIPASNAAKVLFTTKE